MYFNTKLCEKLHLLCFNTKICYVSYIWYVFLCLGKKLPRFSFADFRPKVLLWSSKRSLKAFLDFCQQRIAILGWNPPAAKARIVVGVFLVNVLFFFFFGRLGLFLGRIWICCFFSYDELMGVIYSSWKTLRVVVVMDWHGMKGELWFLKRSYWPTILSKAWTSASSFPFIYNMIRCGCSTPNGGSLFITPSVLPMYDQYP